jgi:hypothetical protein
LNAGHGYAEPVEKEVERDRVMCQTFWRARAPGDRVEQAPTHTSSKQMVLADEIGHGHGDTNILL